MRRWKQFKWLMSWVNNQICTCQFPVFCDGLFWIIFRLFSPRLSGAVGQCNKVLLPKDLFCQTRKTHCLFCLRLQLHACNFCFHFCLVTDMIFAHRARNTECLICKQIVLILPSHTGRKILVPGTDRFHLKYTLLSLVGSWRWTWLRAEFLSPSFP